MRFYVSPGDGSPGRWAGEIAFMTSDGATYTLTAKYEGFEADGPDTALLES